MDTSIDKYSHDFPERSTATPPAKQAFSNQVVVGSGLSVNFSTVGPEGGSPTATLAAAGYTQYLATQLVVGSTCTTPGDIPDIISKLSYSEN